MSATLEHVNFTATDPDKTAALFCTLFDWRVRWSGAALGNGRTVHVGDNKSYIAIYTPGDGPKDGQREPERLAGLNHIGVVVSDLDDVERRVKEAGLEPINHADYEPGRRFYFFDHDGVEIEVISYS